MTLDEKNVAPYMASLADNTRVTFRLQLCFVGVLSVSGGLDAGGWYLESWMAVATS